MDSYRAFDKKWFHKNQSKLLRFLRFKLFRKLLRIDTDLPIVQIKPNAYTVWLGGYKLQSDFRTHDKYSKRLYHAFKPLWWTMHAWDKLADPFFPKLSFGFDTLTRHPDPNPESTTVDGRVRNFQDGGTWATCRAATDGTDANDVDTSIQFVAAGPSGIDWFINRGFFLFDTSALTASATISDAVFSLAANGAAVQNANTTDLDIVSSSPASNTGLVVADYDQVGSTVFGSKALSAWVATNTTYNDITLDANGIANISKTAISKFGARIARDTDNAQPTGANGVECYMAEQTGTSNDPRLVVTYTTGPDYLIDLTSSFKQGVKIIG